MEYWKSDCEVNFEGITYNLSKGEGPYNKCKEFKMILKKYELLKKCFEFDNKNSTSKNLKFRFNVRGGEPYFYIEHHNFEYVQRYGFTSNPENYLVYSLNMLN